VVAAPVTVSYDRNSGFREGSNALQYHSKAFLKQGKNSPGRENFLGAEIAVLKTSSVANPHCSKSLE